MKQDGAATFFIIEHETKGATPALNRWGGSNFDNFRLDPLSRSRMHDGWQRIGVNCWLDQAEAVIALNNCAALNHGINFRLCRREMTQKTAVVASAMRRA